MDFEWVETKRLDLWEKHGIEILDAALIFENRPSLKFTRTGDVRTRRDLPRSVAPTASGIASFMSIAATFAV
jgi:uncharacterized DUF497 family protein